MTHHPATLNRRPSLTKGLLQAALGAVLSLSSAVLVPRTFAADSAAAATGVVTGNVTNKTTGNGLIGAKVEIPALKLSAFVDNTGRYLLNVPVGTHELVVTYTALDTQTSTVVISAGSPAVRDFVMTSSVMMLDSFKVVSEKAGQASAMTQQRNADNLKNVASMDALADLPNMNATELAIRLPGVSFADPGDEVVESISVRGMGAGMTSITIDGGGMSSFSAQNRNTRMTAFTGAMFESLELTKGQTPDRPVDSLGGGVNFKTRSPLNMREKRRVTYSVTARMAPYFSEQIPLREARRTHELVNVSYTEKFAIFGSGTENLAVSVNAFKSENAFGFYRTSRDYQQAPNGAINTNGPAYLWSYGTTDNYNNRKQQSLNTKWDFRLSRTTLLKLNLIYNDAPEPMRRQYNTSALASGGPTTATGNNGQNNQTVLPNNLTNTTFIAANQVPSAIVPGWTDRITTVRPVQIAAVTATPNSGTSSQARIDIGSTLIQRDQRLRHMDLAGEHTFGPLDVDWGGLWSRTRYRTLGAEGALTNRIGFIPMVGPNGGPITTVRNTVPLSGPNGETGVGWILDRTKSDLYPQFLPNGGLDWTNPNNYRPSENGLSTSSGNLDIDLVKEARAHLRYKLPVDAFTAFLKGGYQVRDHNVELYRVNRRWSYIGTTALKTDPSILSWDRVKSGRQLPLWEGAEFIQNGQPTNPALWQEDKYYYEQNKLSASVRTHEIITGYYLMTQGKIGRLGFLGGVRREITNTIGYSNQGARVRTTAQQQLDDPIGSALRDFNHPNTNEGDYGQNFPSIHSWYDLTPDLKVRGSATTGFARPNLNNAVIGVSGISLAGTNANYPDGVLTFGNPALKPTRAKNWDFSLEYYFQPSGSLTVGWFYKRLDDYIVSGREIGTVETGLDNGFEGQYEGFTILGNANAGTAFTQGVEFSYSQQFRFLPGLLKGLRFNANLTQITAHGDYGVAGAYFRNKYVNGFIPRTMNASLSWDYKKFSASISYNYTAEHIRGTYNIAQPSRNQFLMARELVNTNLRYQLRPNLTLNFGVQNLFNEPQRYYRGVADQLQTFLVNGTTITGGIEGRF